MSPGEFEIEFTSPLIGRVGDSPPVFDHPDRAFDQPTGLVEHLGYLPIGLLIAVRRYGGGGATLLLDVIEYVVRHRVPSKDRCAA